MPNPANLGVPTHVGAVLLSYVHDRARRLKNDGKKRVGEITAEEAEEGKHGVTFTPGLVSATRL